MGRIRRQQSFRALARPDGRATSGGVTVAYVSNQSEGPFPAVGYAIGRRHGGATVRNRLRRRLRAAMGKAAPDLPAGAYLLWATPSAAAQDFAGLCRAVAAAASAASRAPAARSGAALAPGGAPAR